MVDSSFKNEYGSSLELSTWVSLSWKDEYLTWDRAEYGIEMLNVDSGDLWRPTISAFTVKDTSMMESSCTDHKCEVKHNGEVSCLSPCSFTARCRNTNVDWPFDIMRCELEFSTWLEFEAQVNLTGTSNVSTTYLWERDFWKMLSAEKGEYNLSNKNYQPLVKYQFTFERHMGIYTVILLPGFMVVAICLVALWLDAKNVERLYILCATCMGNYVFLEYIQWHIPYQTKDVPKTLLFFRDSLLINAFMIIFTVILKHADRQSHGPVERVIERWASRAASSRMGGVLLHRGHSIKGRLLEDNDGADGEIHNRTSNGNDHSINLAIDTANDPAFVGGNAKNHQNDLVITFIDRIALGLSLICYVVMLINLSTLYLYVWMSSTWKDEYLTWDRTEYGIDKVVVDSDLLWRPTFQTGTVMCVSPCQYEALCFSDTSSWPFDSLKCNMFLGSWLQDVNQINISRNSNVSTRDIEVTHAEWQIQSVEKLHIFLPDNTSYPSLEYVFVMKRHIAIYGAILTPGFLMIVISLAVLWMNSGSTERLYILCATCMGHFTYMEYLYWRVPYHGEKVPKMLIFFRDSLIINALMVALTIVLRHMAPSADSEERMVDKLASRIASTTLGRVLLQADDPTDAKQPGAADEENVDTDSSGKIRSDNFEGDTVNLVNDGPEGASAPVTRP
uniref:Neurotransmitter-gated ion-channel ligand-binding domain-containing protein n=1 Tax=Anopheles epiroticus TaxID=199890 RepID=A0A182PTQ6_9DIPT